MLGLISLGLTPFLGIPWTNSSAQISPDELQNYSLPVNAQNMPLLQAATNSVPHISKEDLMSGAFSDNEALLSEKRPMILASNAGSSTRAEVFAPESSDQISVYIVHDGDTVPAIASMFNVSPNTIRWANDLGPKSSIKKDQKLIILPISGVKYIVKKGDTVKSIASSFKGDTNEIIAFNGLEGASDIKAGDEIIIPNGEMVAGSAASKNGTGSISTPKNLASKGVNTGYFMRPIIGGIKTQGIHGHNGVDLASSRGSSILAAAAGQVIIAKSGGWNGGYGSYIVVSHPNGMQTLYAHLNSVNVRQGQQVDKGDVIGSMGSTGDSSGVHLHFEVRGGVNPF